MSESPVFGKLHDLLLWLVPLTLKFPREHRFVLAQQMQQHAFGLQSQLLHAARLRPAVPWLQRADVSLAQLRGLFRLAYELSLVTPGQYEHFAALSTEIGRLLGAWLKRG